VLATEAVKTCDKQGPTASLLDLTTFSPKECVLFWKPFKEIYSKKVEHQFGDTAVVRPFSGCQKRSETGKSCKENWKARNESFHQCHLPPMLSGNLADKNMTAMMRMMRIVMMNKKKKPSRPHVKEQIFKIEERCRAVTLRKANAAKSDIEGYNETRKMVSDAITDHRFSYWKRRSLDKKNNLFEK
jgi:hypothetical protein